MATKAKKAKLLVETSCVPVALGESTRRHVSEFQRIAGTGELHTSVYIRKEFIRGWIKTYIKLCFQILYFQNVDEALIHLEQDFGAREPKRLVHAVSLLLREKGGIENSEEAAVEVARLAVKKLKQFDKVFSVRIANACGCQIGAKPLVVDFCTLMDSLRLFLESVSELDDCPVNDYLKTQKVDGTGGRFAAAKGVTSTSAGKNLADLIAKGNRFGCKKCASIGDVVIALEQPPSWQMLSIDKAFEVLCAARGRSVTIVPSERAVESDAPRIN